MHRSRIMLLDGYNIIHRAPTLRARLNESLLTAREALVRTCAEWIAGRGDVDKFYVVFDGDSSVDPAGMSPAPGVNVLYTRTRETADERIIALLQEERPDCTYVVVSDDNYVMHHAREARAGRLSVKEFCDLLGRTRERRRRNDGGAGAKNALTPDQERNITDSLRRIWGAE